MIADPVSLFDSAPDADGAAAVVLTSAERAGDLVPQPIRIIGSGAASDTLALHDRDDLLALKAVALSTRKALAQAGIDRDAIDLLELHDAFTILSVLALEAAEFAERGEGWKLADQDRAGRQAADQHVRRAEKPGQPGWRNRRLPGGRSGASASREGGRESGRRCQNRHQPGLRARRYRQHGDHPRPAKLRSTHSDDSKGTGYAPFFIPNSDH
ncbi:MAG: hypothetical protein U0521_04850 [Anaerolineae bacterium]